MESKMKQTHQINDRTLTLTRTFNAPRELVFDAFSKCEHLQHWWGPRGWTLPVCDIDFRPGGIWNYCMKGPNGEDSCGIMTFHEIERPVRFVSTDQFADTDGNVMEGMPTMRNTVIFSEEGGRTTITNHVEYETDEQLQTVIEMGMLEGVTETWDRLEEYLAELQ